MTVAVLAPVLFRSELKVPAMKTRWPTTSMSQISPVLIRGVGLGVLGTRPVCPGAGCASVRRRRRHQASGEGREDDRDRGDDGDGSDAAWGGAWHVVSRSERSDCWTVSGC